jgi:hypothetical protein
VDTQCLHVVLRGHEPFANGHTNVIGCSAWRIEYIYIYVYINIYIEREREIP